MKSLAGSSHCGQVRGSLSAILRLTRHRIPTSCCTRRFYHGYRDSDPRFALSESLIGELEAADFVVIGTPMNNFAVPSTLKAWIDHIVRIRRTFRSTAEGKIGILQDRPVIVVSAHGGYRGERPPGQPDFLSLYLETISRRSGSIHFYS